MKKYVILLSFVFLYGEEIVIDLSKQELTLFEGKGVLMRASISSGNKNHPTPTGSFKVFQKKRYHKSTLYPIHEDGKRGGADMNYMLKFAPAIAIHEGYIPTEKGRSIPASHGCIRINTSDAKKLFSLVDINTKVIVKGRADYKNNFNRELDHPHYVEESNLNLTINTSDIEEIEGI